MACRRSRPGKMREEISRNASPSSPPTPPPPVLCPCFADGANTWTPLAVFLLRYGLPTAATNRSRDMTWSVPRFACPKIEDRALRIAVRGLRAWLDHLPRYLS